MIGLDAAFAAVLEPLFAQVGILRAEVDDLRAQVTELRSRLAAAPANDAGDGVPLFMTVADAAVRFGVSRKTLHRRLAEGRLTAHRLGPRIIRLAVAELDHVFRNGPPGSRRAQLRVVGNEDATREQPP